MITTWNAEWWAATLGNVGVTLLLAAPVAFYINAVSRNVKVARSDIEKVRKGLTETQSEVRNLRNDATMSSRQVDSHVDGLFSVDPKGENIGPEHVLDLLKTARKQRLISGRGYRIEIPGCRLYVRFRYDQSSNDATIGVEPTDGRPEFEELSITEKSLASALAEVRAYCIARGSSDFSAMYPIEEIFRQLRELRERGANSPDLIYDIQESLPGNWYIADDGLAHYDPSWDIAHSRLNEQDWIAHLRDKTWFNYDESFHALAVARELLSSGLSNG